MLLPLTYDNGRIRDFEAVVPQATPLTAVLSANPRLILADATGAAPSAQGVRFQASPPAASTALQLLRMFPPPNATIISYHVTGVR